MHGNAEFRFGSARLATLSDVYRAGLFGAQGLILGEFRRRMLRIDSDAPVLTIAGSGAGKLATLLAYSSCLAGSSCLVPARCVYLDLRGEIAAISAGNQVRHGKPAFTWNPRGLHGLPRHSINPVAILRGDSPSLVGDVKATVENLISTAKGGDDNFFDQRAQAIGELFLTYDALRHGVVSLRRVTNYHAAMMADGSAWRDVLAPDIAATSPALAQKLQEVIKQRQESERTFSGVAATFSNAIAFLSDPQLRESISDDPDIDLLDFATGAQPANLYLVAPGDALQSWAPLLRMVFSTLMIAKSRAPHALRLNLIVDEAGQLGHAPFLKSAFTFGRGAGIKAWALFQDIGQIEAAYGRSGVQTFMASAEVRQFFGVRDFETAELVSKMVGNATLHYTDPYRHAEAKAAKAKAVHSIVSGHADPVQAMLEAKRASAAMELQSQQPRAVLDPAEVMALTERQQVILTSKGNCPPILAGRRPYWEARAMAGQFLPNPYHPPAGSVRLRGRFGMRERRVIEEAVPERFAYLPQYAGGTWRYVDGFKP